MANFVVLKASSGDVPGLGTTGSADIYRGDHPTLPDAMAAAAQQWRLGPTVKLWGTLESNLTRHITSVTTAAG